MGTKVIIYIAFPRFHLGLFTFNPFRVEAFLRLLSPGSTWGYSYSTPLGLRRLVFFPQVSPGAIISLRSLLRFTFNPFRVEAFLRLLSPGSTWGYSHSTPSGLAF